MTHQTIPAFFVGFFLGLIMTIISLRLALTFCATYFDMKQQSKPEPPDEGDEWKNKA